MLGLNTAEKRKVSGEFSWQFGDFYNGDLNTIEATVAVKPSELFTLEFTAERNTGTVQALIDEEGEALADTDFTEEVFGVRLQLNISPDLQLSSFTQYDTESREIGTNNRLRWTFDPLGDLFLVYNHNIERRVTDDRWRFVSNQLPLKIQYTRRL